MRKPFPNVCAHHQAFKRDPHETAYHPHFGCTISAIPEILGQPSSLQTVFSCLPSFLLIGRTENCSGRTPSASSLSLLPNTSNITHLLLPTPGSRKLICLLSPQHQNLPVKLQTSVKDSPSRCSYKKKNPSTEGYTQAKSRTTFSMKFMNLQSF